MGGAGVTAAVTFVGKLIGGSKFAAAFAAAAFTFVVSKASSMMSKQDRSEPFGQGRTQTVRQEAAPRQIIYGETRTGGVYTFMRVTDNNRYFHMVITLSGHECENIGDVYYDGDVVQEDGGDIISKFRGERDSGDVSVVNGRFQTPEVLDGADIDLTQFKKGTIVNVSGMANDANNGDHRITDIVVDEPSSVIYMEVEDTLTDESETSATFQSDFVKINKHLGAADQAADSDLVRLIDDWTEDHRQRECAYMYIRVRWNRDKWPTGIPNFSAVVKGKNDIYDPRSDSTGYSENPALCIADFLTWERYGFGADYATEINEDELIASANVCDESVNLADGGTETRYTCNGAMSSGSKIAPNLNAIMGSMAGEVIWSGGQWYILAGYYRTPEVTFDESDLTGGLSIVTGISRNQLFNSIKGTYVSPDNRYIEAGFPAVTNSTYVSNDGGEKSWENIELPFTDSPSMAQRIAKIQLEQVRQQITVSMPVNLKGLDVKAGDVVKVTNARMGWTEKPFEVTDWELALDSPDENPIFGVNLELRETASGVYDWNSGEETEVDLAPDTDLPDPFSVTAPTNLTVKSGTAQLYRKKDGTVVTRTRMDWTESVDSFVQEYEVQYKRSSDSEWQAGGKPETDDTHWYIWDVEDGEDYDHRIRAINPFGPRSDWLTDTDHTVIGKTAPPEDVTNLAATTANWISGGSKQYGIHLTWDDVSDADLGRYEVRTDTNFGSKAGRIARPKDDQAQLPIASADSYTFYIKAQDTSKNYSDSADSTSITIEAPDEPSGISATTTNKLDGAARSYGIHLSWTDNETDFPVQTNRVYDSSGTLLDEVNGTKSTLPITGNGTYTFEVEPVDVAGNAGTRGSVSITISEPGAPTGISATTTNKLDGNSKSYGIRLNWTNNETDFPIVRNHVYRSGQLIDSVSGTESTLPITTDGSYTFDVESEDVAGNLSSRGSESITIEAPGQPSLGTSFSGADLKLSWTAASENAFPVAFYDVRRGGSDFESATPVDTVQAREFKFRVDWSGTQTWRIAAVDVAGNYGTASSIDVQVNAPGKPPNYRSKVFGEDVLLFWDASSGTLPIDYYQITRDSSATANLGDGTNEAIARSTGTFGSITESESGTFAYWVQPFDTAGNAGTAAKLTSFVDEPADFLLQNQFDPDFTNGTRTNMALQEVGVNSILGPFDTSETWEDHFVGTGSASTPQFDNVQDLIDAGYTYYLQPGTPNSGSYVEEFDAGAVLDTTRIIASWNQDVLDGSPTVSVGIEVRASTGDSWRSFSGDQVVANDVRYVRLTLTVNGSSNSDLIEISNLSIRLTVRRVTAEGTATADSGDAPSPTSVTMETTFLDIRAINVTPKSGDTGYPINWFVEWDDTSPTNTFDIIFIRTDTGDRVTQFFSYTARGIKD